MLRRSVTSGTRRRMALLRSCCALLALALLLSALERSTLGQSPALVAQQMRLPDQSAAPALPPPAPPPAAVDQPAPAATGTAQPADAQQHPHSAKASEPKVCQTNGRARRLPSDIRAT